MIGVIGGMGPLATADFLQKVIATTPAEHDEQHVPLLISCDARIPSRPMAILQGSESPLPRLLGIRNKLIDAGATGLVMPCNTAHYWHPDLLIGCPVPFPSIIDAAIQAAAVGRSNGAKIGVIATRGTLAAKLFEPALERRNLHALLPTDALLDETILPSIAHVKAGRLAAAGPLMAQAVRGLLDQGADVVVLACTEAPIALTAASGDLSRYCIDTTQALAEATVALWMQLKPP